MNKKNLLLIMSRLPYPPVGGDKLKSYNILKILSKHYNVYLVVITDEVLTSKIEDELKKWTVHLKVFTKKKYLCYFNTLKSFINNLPLQVNYYYFKDVKEYIDKISSEVDFAISTLIRTSEYLREFNKPKLLDAVDSIALNYQRSYSNTKSLFWKLIYKIETKRLFKYERRCVKEFDITFFVNKFEAEYWSNVGKTKWIPNGVNEKLLYYNKQNDDFKNCIVFFGKMNYQPNIDAVLWFAENVLDKINKNIKFVIVGANPSKKILELAKSNKRIMVTGYLEDPYEVINSSLLVVAPMRTGGGIQNKVLEAMALGKICIVSSLAAKPIIGAKDREHFFVSDDPIEIAEIINSIYENSDRYKFIGENAKNLIRSLYNWGNYEKSLIKMVEDVLSQR